MNATNKAPEGKWFTQNGENIRRRMFSKQLFLKDPSHINNYVLWTDEQRNEYIESRKNGK